MLDQATIVRKCRRTCIYEFDSLVLHLAAVDCRRPSRRRPANGPLRTCALVGSGTMWTARASLPRRLTTTLLGPTGLVLSHCRRKNLRACILRPSSVLRRSDKEIKRHCRSLSCKLFGRQTENASSVPSVILHSRQECDLWLSGEWACCVARQCRRWHPTTIPPLNIYVQPRVDKPEP